MNNTQEDTKNGYDLSATIATSAEPTLTPAASKSGEDGELISKALRFLATASAETLGAIAVGLTACTYLVLGRIGLVIIGVVTGVVLQATWEGQNTGSSEDARKEKGLDVVRRILDLRNSKTIAENDEGDVDIVGNSFEGFRPETSVALTELVEVSQERKDLSGGLKWENVLIPLTTGYYSRLCQMVVQSHTSKGTLLPCSIATDVDTLPPLDISALIQEEASR